MRDPRPVDSSSRRPHLFYQATLISLGFGAIRAAIPREPLGALIALLAAAALIAAAFLGVPKAIVLYARQRQGIRPSYEAFFDVAGPLFLVAATAWMAISEARGLYFISALVTPSGREIAGPLICVPALLMNLGVLVLNVISLTRRRKGID